MSGSSRPKTPLVANERFILAIRDSGYTDVASAVAELVDNAIEAAATRVRITVDCESHTGLPRLSVNDNGEGMTKTVLRTAVQFGGSSRFGSRQGTGRYGMGLPNSSVSQAKRLDVYAWRHRRTWHTYLDVDEIRSGRLATVPEPQPATLPADTCPIESASGTLVIWTKCDRLRPQQPASVAKRIRAGIGRLFRRSIWDGVRIEVNGDDVRPIDPLFLQPGANLVGALPFGPALCYDLRTSNQANTVSKVTVQFAELPIQEWHDLSNKEKRSNGIAKRAGMSVVRAGREIDYGWFFMGRKRKENYDDWWRCELCFDPELDEAFGVTHTKQGIRPSEHLAQVIAPEIEKIAHVLNARVRDQFASIKRSHATTSEHRAEVCDERFDPLPTQIKKGRHARKPIAQTAYRLTSTDSASEAFYVPVRSGNRIELKLNRLHPFYRLLYEPLAERSDRRSALIRTQLELLLFAAGRAEIGTELGPVHLEQFRQEWGNLLAAFLS